MKNNDPKEKRILFYFILIFVVFAICIIVAGIQYYRSSEKQFRTDVENQLTAIADLKVSQIVQWRKERHDDGNLFYKNDEFTQEVIRYFINPNNSEAKNIIQTWMSKVKTGYNYDAIFLIDTNNTKRIIVSERIERPKSFISPGNYDSLKKGKIVFEDLYYDETLQKIFMKILVPILDEKDNNSLIAIVELRINPETYLYPLIDSWPIPSKTPETLIARREGESTVFLNEIKFRKNSALNYKIPLEEKDILVVKAVLGEKGVVEGLDYKGDEVIGYVCPIPNSPWYMVARMDKAEMYAPLKEKLWSMIVFVIVLILTTGLGLGFIWRHQRVNYYKEKADAAAELRKSEQQLKSYIENAGDAIYVIQSATGRFMNCNARACHYLGYSKDELLRLSAKDIEAILPEAKIGAIHHELNAGDARTISGMHKRKDGTTFPVEIRLSSLAPVQPELMIAMVRDVTEQKKAEEEIHKLNNELEQRVIERTNQLEAANKELEAFAYSVSHDLRSPLRAIEGFSRFLYDDYYEKLDDEAKRLLNIIRDNTRRMDQLITDLLALSRVTRSELKYSRIDMTALAKSMYVEIVAEELKKEFVFNVTKLPDAYGDGNIMRQVWINLISNAIKFSMKSKLRKIEIGCTEDNGINVYYIKDEGIGFDNKYKHKLFGVFQRLHSSEEFEGTGVGLAIVQRIVHRHGGEVWAEGEIEKGATFYFTIGQAIGNRQ